MSINTIYFQCLNCNNIIKKIIEKPRKNDHYIQKKIPLEIANQINNDIVECKYCKYKFIIKIKETKFFVPLYLKPWKKNNA